MSSTSGTSARPAWSRVGVVGLVVAALVLGTPGRASFHAGPNAPPAPTRQRPPRYYPGPGDDWERRLPAAVGLDADGLRRAVAFAVANETPMPRDVAQYLRERFRDDPHGELIGPLTERGEPNGLVLRHGYIVAEWGDTRRVDMTFSTTKSYLATTAGLALDAGRIRDIHEPVRASVRDGGFDSPHNAKITWHQLLRQTSEWEGVLWGKPDSADRRRGRSRSLREPGTFWEYNDVRVNRTALALLRVWGRPLPDVLHRHVMDPIGASATWRWHGYRNSYVTVNGRRVQSVSGGGHWGGGMWISSRDHARFGLLHLRRGRWRERQLVSEQWIELATAPGEHNPLYGYMWWLNTGHGLWPRAPEESFAALGAGSSNVIWIDPVHDLVAVLRWSDGERLDEFLGMLVGAVRDGG